VYPDGLLNLIMQVIVGAVGGGVMISGDATVSCGGTSVRPPRRRRAMMT